jgi:23S rRNA (uracil1939-C5)-methyltransferase
MRAKNKENKPSKASMKTRQDKSSKQNKVNFPDRVMSGYGRGKKKRKNFDDIEDFNNIEAFEDFEDFEDFIDYKDFVKATGWRTSNNRKEGSDKTLRSKAAASGKPSKGAEKSRNTIAGRNGKLGSAEIKTVDNKSIEKRNADKGNSDKWNSERKNSESRNSERRDSENRIAEKRTTEKRNSENRNGENSKSDKKQPLRKVSQKGACPYLRECGGCNIQSQSYEAELASKQKLVEGLLKKYCKVEPILRMEQPDHYRHKVHVVFDHDRKGNPISGVYEEGTHRVIPVDQCLIHNEKADAIIRTIRGLLKSFKIRTYDEDTGYGLLRHVLIRTGYYSKEIMVVLVLGSPILPSKNNFVKALRKEHPEITTVIVNVNDKKTSMVLGEKEQVIYGKGYIEDSLCGKTFRISPKSFYQVNPVQTEKLYQKAIELAGLKGTETVVDAYSGIGTIGIVASDHAKRVIGVELNKDAVKDAIVNAKRNLTDHIEFYNNDAGVFLSQMAEQGESVDVVFMDPPRSGSTTQFLDALVKIKPNKVIYISCNPVTLERDLEYLTKKGYKAETAVPVDMFPWTEHVECVTLMSKVEK